MSEWKPIETAPKDGTRLLLYSDGSYEVASYIERWTEDEEHVGVGRGLYLRAKRECGYWDCDFAVCPTHWMPLPDPPKEAE